MLDLLGRLVKSLFGVTYILMVLDGFTKFVKLYGPRKTTARTCIKNLTGDYFPILKIIFF